jgi:hypothetical protein
MFNLLARIHYRHQATNSTWWRNLTHDECFVIIRAMLNLRKQAISLSETEFEFTLISV